MNRWQERTVPLDREKLSNLWSLRRWYCPECEKWQTYGETPYCPYCGAHLMDDGDEES